MSRERSPGRRRGKRDVDGGAAHAAREVTAARVVPFIGYPDLPVSDRRDEIADAIREHQVVVVAGETGSGKTTQLPKICLELGRGVTGRIGHTQPRRIAARAVAERVADELGDPEAVGYQVRFTDTTVPGALVKVMTDGVLLAEIAHDRLLRRYDTIIVDEAHERSLNIDFLLGYLHRILPRRPDLKVVITSATIDTARFAAHFADAQGRPAPVIEVSGRTYPVEVRYRPYGLEDDRDEVQAVCDAVTELAAHGSGDVLVFLSGEREIRDTTEAVRGLGLPRTEVLPLYGRLSAAEQHRIFEPHQERRIVLSTNVAETSLTVPGIRYVIDAGNARISRYSPRTKVQRLPIEAVSRASADQRAGRCGRVEAGVAIRLYAQEDYEARPRYTDPEILRTNLASVILAMAALDLGEIAGFPFVDAPDGRQVKDGVDLLHELGALRRGGSRGGSGADGPAADPERTREPLRGDGRLTGLGRRLARLPLDPRLGRMVLAAADLGCLEQVLVVAAALSVQDPRERPVDQQAQADQAHSRFRDPSSDFASILRLWEYLQEQQDTLSGNQFRRMCRREFLHYLRVREWQDVRAQLRRTCRELGLPESSAPADPERLHRALLPGLLSHVGAYDSARRDYFGARGRRFTLHPASSLARKPPAYVMAAELVETTRLFARTNARIDPLWAEEAAGGLARSTYSEPRWSRRRAAVVATERVTLFGVPLVVGRTVQYGRIDPVVSRALFLRHALVGEDWDAHHAFLAENRRRVEDVAELETRARRRDLLVDEDARFDFFDARVPEDILSGRHFDRWWKAARREDPDLLTYPRSLLARDEESAAYPEVWTSQSPGLPDLAVSYAFEPGADDDGVTVDVPVTLLNRLSAQDFLARVPGRREEVVTALVRSLPKSLRTRFVPVPDTVRAVLPSLDSARPVAEELAAALTRRAGQVVRSTDFDVDAVPDHLRVSFRVVDPDGRELGRGRDLDVLQDRLAPAVHRSVSAAGRGLEQRGLTAYPSGGVPREVTVTAGDHDVTGYPALVDRGAHVDLVVLPTAAEAAAAMRTGVRRLLRLALRSPAKAAVEALDNRARLALGHTPYPSVSAMLDDVADAVVDAVVDEAGIPDDEVAYDVLQAAVADRIAPDTTRAVADLARVLARAHEVRAAADALAAPAVRDLVVDVRRQLGGLVADGFVSAAGVRRLPDLERYLRAALLRLEKAPADLARDRVRTDEVAVVAAAVAEAAAARPGPEADDLRWWLEELRVSLYAQGIRTARPTSSTRILRAASGLAGG